MIEQLKRCTHTQLPNNCLRPFLFFFGEMSLFPSILVPSPFFLCMERASYVLSFRMVFFLRCDHGLDFFTSAYVIIQTINQDLVQCVKQWFHKDKLKTSEYLWRLDSDLSGSDQQASVHIA